MTILKNTHSSIINPGVMKMSLVYELQTLFSFYYYIIGLSISVPFYRQF